MQLGYQDSLCNMDRIWYVISAKFYPVICKFISYLIVSKMGLFSLKQISGHHFGFRRLFMGRAQYENPIEICAITAI